uniref:Uncharacterized protein n=1 Tax=Rhizophora mucronata TaxID=61149 RepID=A0A2P2NQR1_RHIMU
MFETISGLSYSKTKNIIHHKKTT